LQSTFGQNFWRLCVFAPKPASASIARTQYTCATALCLTNGTNIVIVTKAHSKARTIAHTNTFLVPKFQFLAPLRVGVFALKRRNDVNARTTLDLRRVHASGLSYAPQNAQQIQRYPICSSSFGR